MKNFIKFYNFTHKTITTQPYCIVWIFYQSNCNNTNRLIKGCRWLKKDSHIYIPRRNVSASNSIDWNLIFFACLCRSLHLEFNIKNNISIHSLETEDIEESKRLKMKEQERMFFHNRNRNVSAIKKDVAMFIRRYVRIWHVYWKKSLFSTNPIDTYLNVCPHGSD